MIGTLDRFVARQDLTALTAEGQAIPVTDAKNRSRSGVAGVSGVASAIIPVRQEQSSWQPDNRTRSITITQTGATPIRMIIMGMGMGMGTKATITAITVTPRQCPARTSGRCCSAFC
ncbi:hypothetical protein [Jiella mangrovi]|uniref:hypothetical protein n=1 Tax=Jiella mangrovi TaxID=2821407 RepID=UPI0031591E3A